MTIAGTTIMVCYHKSSHCISLKDWLPVLAILSIGTNLQTSDSDLINMIGYQDDSLNNGHQVACPIA